MPVDFLFEPIADAALTSAPGVLAASGGYVYDVASNQVAHIAAFAVRHPIVTCVIATVAAASVVYTARAVYFATERAAEKEAAHLFWKLSEAAAPKPQPDTEFLLSQIAITEFEIPEMALKVTNHPTNPWKFSIVP